MKDLGKTTLCLGLHVEHLEGSIFLHQSLYTQKLFKCLSMDAAHPLSSSMVVRSLDLNEDEFRPCDEGEKCLGPETPYLAAIGALCIWQIAPSLTLHLPLIYWQDLMLSQHNDIAMVSNVSYDTSRAMTI